MCERGRNSFRNRALAVVARDHDRNRDHRRVPVSVSCDDALAAQRRLPSLRLSADNLDHAMAFEQWHHSFEMVRLPVVVRIEPGDSLTRCSVHAGVPASRRATCNQPTGRNRGRVVRGRIEGVPGRRDHARQNGRRRAIVARAAATRKWGRIQSLTSHLICADAESSSEYRHIRRRMHVQSWNDVASCARESCASDDR